MLQWQRLTQRLLVRAMTRLGGRLWWLASLPRAERRPGRRPLPPRPVSGLVRMRRPF